MIGKLAALVCASVACGGIAASSVASPVTKQNGSTPVFNNFTSICGVPGYASYGACNGDTTTFTNVTGRINAVQSKDGRWNLGFTFTNLTPGQSYQLWGAYTGYAAYQFFSIATVVADASGVARFSYQTTTPKELGFDLNFASGNWAGITLVTSFWSNQQIQVLNADGTLYVPQV
jgi:hypothetical protein